MSKTYSPKIITDSLVMCLDPSHNKSYPAADLPVKDQLNLWLDAADDSTFSYSSGTTVSQWRDKSGQNNHAVVYGGSPLRSVAINSRKSVSFTSTSWFRCLTGNFTSNATHIVVCRSTASSTDYQRVYNGGSDAFVFIGAFSNNIATFWGTGASWNDVNINAPTTTILNTLRIISAINTGAGATPYSNGTAMTVKSTNSAAYTGYGLNSSSGVLSQPLTGEVCEIIVFNKQLSLTELKQVHTYLGQKWGISNTDRSIIDLAGNDDNGLLGNGTVANMPDYDFYNKGALTFNGTSDYITIPSSSNIKNTSALSLEGWVFISSSMNYYGGIIGKGTTDTDEEYCLLVHTVNSKVYMDVGSTGGPYTDATFSFSLNTWYHIIGTHERIAGSSTIKIYVNGALLSGSTVNPTNAVNDNSTAVSIGSRFSDGTLPWNGKIANVKIYTKTLSAAEVLQNYEAQKSKFANTIVQQGLVLNLDAGNIYSYAGAGTTIYDVSPTALSWTINNATYNSSDPKYFSYNGSNSWLESSTSAAYDSQTITMECWCYPTTLAQDGFLFEKGQVNTQYSMFLALSGFFYFRTKSISTEDLSFTPSTYLTANAWNHIVCTFGAGTKTVYVNGTQSVQQTGLTGTLPTGQTNQYIGKYGDVSNSFPFNGRIGESRVYNIALSAAQVLQNYNATKGRFGL